MGGGFFPVGSTVRSLDCLTQRPVSHGLLLAQIIQRMTSGTQTKALADLGDATKSVLDAVAGFGPLQAVPR